MFMVMIEAKKTAAEEEKNKNYVRRERMQRRRFIEE